MSLSMSSPITGMAVSGLTSPTYTVTADQSPTPQSRQWIVSALGGTQTGATAHSVAAPFTITMFRPRQMAIVPPANSNTGLLTKRPTRNEYRLKVRKAGTPLAGNPDEICDLTLSMSIPAGVETTDIAEFKAALSALGGVLTTEANNIVTAVQTGSI